MRKFVYTALLIVALGCFAGASVAYAGDCCQPKCKQHTCSKCDKGCGECKHKCESCKPKCESCKPKCEPCKPKCESKCNSCKPKCESKCNKCSPCKSKCESKCNRCTSKCADNWGGGKWVDGYDACCPPEMGVKEICVDSCSYKGDGCGRCGSSYQHPYEQCWNGTGMLCDTGACGTFLPCKRQCVTCETVCKEVKSVDPCTGCETVEYVTETVCHELERPTVIPWWFNEKGDGNIYVDAKPAEEAK
jgi:hypothetical protein